MDEDTNVPASDPTPPAQEPTEQVPPASEGKPIGPATVVQDDPSEQFPAHDENLSS